MAIRHARPELRPARDQHRAENIDQHIAFRLRQRRYELGLTQMELAQRIGLTYQQVHKYETGTNRLSAGRLYRIAQALEVEVGYFFEGLGFDREAGSPVVSGERQQRLLELARNFAALPDRQHREVLCALARALAGSTGAAEEENEGPIQGAAA